MTDYSKTPESNNDNYDQTLTDELRTNQLENERLQAQLEEQQRQERLAQQQVQNESSTETENSKKFKKKSYKTPSEQIVVNNDKQIHDALDTVEDAKDQVHDARKDIGKKPTLAVDNNTNQPKRKTRKKRQSNVKSNVKKAVAGVAGAVAGKKLVDKVTDNKADESSLKKQEKREVDPFESIKERAESYGNKAKSSKSQYDVISSYFQDLKTLDPSADKKTFVKDLQTVMDKHGVKYNDLNTNDLDQRFGQHLANVKRQLNENKLQYQAYSALSDNLSNIAETKDARQLNNYGKDLTKLYHKANAFSDKKMDEYNKLNDVDSKNVSKEEIEKLTPNYQGANNVDFRLSESKKDAGSYAKTFKTIARDYNDTVTNIADVVAKTNNGLVQNVNDKSERKKDDVKIKNATEYKVDADKNVKAQMPVESPSVKTGTIVKGNKIDSKAETAIRNDKQINFDDSVKEDSAQLATGVEDAFDNKEKSDLVTKLQAENQSMKQEMKAMQERLNQLENKPNQQTRKKKFLDKFRQNSKQFENVSNKDLLMESSMRFGKGVVKFGAKTAVVVLGAVGTASLYAGHKVKNLAVRISNHLNNGAQNAMAQAMGVQLQPKNNGLAK